MKLPLISVALSACALLLSACSQPSVATPVLPGSAVPEPEIKLPDYLAVACNDVWQVENPAAMSNPLYWLRAIDCAERLSPAQARAEAHRWPVEDWARAFKQGILLANGNVTPPERRAFVDTLDSYSSEFPGAVRPLIQLWRSHQAAQLDLSEARSRYAHLQQTSDGELDTLRRQQHQLAQDLADKQRKLERLTDIERQLSSRKSPDVPDGSHAASPDASGAADGNSAQDEDR
jgi:YfhG lipoprotein